MTLPSLCPVCGAALAGPALERSGNSRLYGCGRCEVQVWHPATNPGPDWYGEDDQYLAKTVVGWLGWNHAYGLKSLPPETRSLLDVGCADGRFVYAAARRGIDAWGIDFSPRLVHEGNARYGGTRLEVATLEEHLARSPAPVDVVTMFEVVEHVEDPLGFVRLAIQAVRPGGLVIISTPNRLGLPRPPRGYDEPPHHLTRWTPAALQELARRAGLEPIHVELCPPEIALKSIILDRTRLGLITRSLRAWRRARPDTPVATDRAARRIIGSLIRAKDWIAYAIAKAITPLIGRSFSGGQMVLLARRPA